MTEDTEARLVAEALDAVCKAWAGAPEIERMEFELGQDQTGDPSVFITVLLNEKTPSAQWTSANLDPMEDRIREAIRHNRIEDRLVYVRFLRPSDLQHTGLNG